MIAGRQQPIQPFHQVLLHIQLIANKEAQTNTNQQKQRLEKTQPQDHDTYKQAKNGTEKAATLIIPDIV